MRKGVLPWRLVKRFVVIKIRRKCEEEIGYKMESVHFFILFEKFKDMN